MAGEGGGDIRARFETPVGALAIRPRQIGRDGFANKVVELRVSEHRARAADQRVNGRRRGVRKRPVLPLRSCEAGCSERAQKRALLLAPLRDRLARLERV